MDAFLRHHGDRDPQTPFDVAVVIPTLLRPCLEQALFSAFSQDLAGTVQVLLGIDRPEGGAEGLDGLERILALRPPHMAVSVLYPGYSTSIRHGGLYPATDGGALRTVLTLLANSRYVAYLDDDNWWAPHHLSSLRRVLDRGFHWAFSLRWLVHPGTLAPICVDRWESVGPGLGVFADKAGGFCDPNTLMVDKMACPRMAPLWSYPLHGDPNGQSADRNIFRLLADNHPGGGTGLATSYYRLDPADDMHRLRLEWMGGAYAAAGRPD